MPSNDQPDNIQPESAEIRSSVLSALSLAIEPMRCDQVAGLVHADYSPVRRVLANLTRGGLVAWTQAAEGRAETFTLTVTGREAAELLADPKLRSIQSDLMERARRYLVAPKSQALYVAIGLDYLTGMSMTDLMAKYGNYEKIMSARRALHIEARRPGNAHPST